MKALAKRRSLPGQPQRGAGFNAGKRHPTFVLDACRRWAKAGEPHTDWIIKDGLRKLRESEPEQVERILDSLAGQSAR